MGMVLALGAAHPRPRKEIYLGCCGSAVAARSLHLHQPASEARTICIKHGCFEFLARWVFCAITLTMASMPPACTSL